VPRVPRRGILAAHNRGSRKFTPAQKEAVLRSYHLHGSYRAVANALGIHDASVKRIVLECQLDPAFAHTRAQAIDEMSGKIAAITDQVIDSIKPEELETTHHKVYDACGNLLRVVQEGPGLKDKALAIGIMLDKQAVLQQVRGKALDTSSRHGGGTGLLLPESIEDMRDMLASKIQSLRILDIKFNNSEVGQRVTSTLEKLGITEEDIADTQYEAAPFD